MIAIIMLLQLTKGQPFPSEPLIMALLLSQNKVIDLLTNQISKHESLGNNNNNKKEVKESKEEDLGRENKHDYIRKNERIHYIYDYYH
jgi:hypothetical protein